jgi:PPOX class probable F420-dependent enzyme
VSRREQIQMDPREVLSFLEEERTVVCATNGSDGWPHLMPLWYVLRDDTIWAWTFAKSQKVRNLERDPRATLQVEAGEEYALLRGVMLRCDTVVHRDGDAVAQLGLEIFARYGGSTGGELADEARAAVHAQATKRVGLEFVERDRATWDHRKLEGTY